MNQDFVDLLRALSDADARFLIVGAYAVGVHGHPRATKDLDVWVEATAENAPKVIRALKVFGAPLMGLTEQDMSKPDVGLQIGVEPGRIDVLTRVSGVGFADVWARRTYANFGDVRCGVIGFDDLLINKRAAGRPQDIADVSSLEELQRLRKR